MATSGSTDFTLNRDQIISAALRKLRVLDPNQTASANDITSGAQALNLMIKAWQMDDIAMWLNQEAVLHLKEDGQTYALGPGASADNFCALTDAGKTQLSAASAASDTTLDVDSDGDSADGDYIGIQLDDGSLEWTTINGTPSSDVITITTGLTGAAAIDNWVFWYTTKIARPLEIIEARVRNTADDDTNLNIITDLGRFMSITDKTSTGQVTDIHLIPTITSSTLYAWPTCDDVTDRIVMTIRRPIEDFDAAGNNGDFPVECLQAVIWNLALQMAPEYMKITPPDVKTNAMIEFAKMKRFYNNQENIQIHP